MKLQIGAIKLATADGPVVIAGWHDGTFGVDWRACHHDLDGPPGGYVVSHLATGWAVVALIANLEDVEEFLVRLHHAGNWGVTSADDAKAMVEDRADALQAVFATLPHHNPACFCMAPGFHGATGGAHGHA